MTRPPATGEIESPRPLQAANGEVNLSGWCLCDGIAPRAIRMVTAAGTIDGTIGQPRPDLALPPGAPAGARNCGFSIRGHLPPGVHAARFEAQASDGSWHAFRSHTIRAGASGLAVEIESPDPHRPATTRQHVSGWALHPAAAITGLSIRYGHCEIPCDAGRAREDVPRRFPAAPDAARSGFQSRTILGAGAGLLRVRARLADGRAVVARTPLQVAILSDENHRAGFRFSGAPLRLPRLRPPDLPPPDRADRPQRVLFVLPGSFAANNALHVAALANELCAAGHDCAVAVPHDLGTISHHDRPRFRGLTHAAVRADGAFADGQAPDIIHAWTPRENVRQLALALRARHGEARLVVHLEDNENHLLAQALGCSTARLADMTEKELDDAVSADLSHPRRAANFLAAADGVTVIVDRLREFVPKGKPCRTLWPAADARCFGPLPLPVEFRGLLDRVAGGTVLFYHGNVHAANAAEMRELYAAVARLNESGQPTTLLRTGLDQVDFLGPFAARAEPHVIALGQILRHRHLPALMALADIFVQPGLPDEFNHYRFPSKLPEFFALGRPVVLPRANLGEHVRHGIDAYVLERADAAGITAAVTELRRDPALRERLGRGAAAFARERFSWRRSASELASFYGSLAASRP